MLPTFETPRLTLRPSCPADLEEFLAMDTHPAVARFIWGDPPDPAERRAELEKRLSRDNTRIGGHWSIFDRATGAFLGWCGLMQLEETGLIEIGYR